MKLFILSILAMAMLVRSEETTAVPVDEMSAEDMSSIKRDQYGYSHGVCTNGYDPRNCKFCAQIFKTNLRWCSKCTRIKEHCCINPAYPEKMFAKDVCLLLGAQPSTW
ncbi:hypothetical protein Ciccas_007309 [Cichlidogyrus casuarinus]|uniref:Uncharacterized protein n=1 Tax=Cichlidogyrus casuarinus TaxID=1844966 RepID=A0ABD2Q5U7_9PLAT